MYKLQNKLYRIQNAKELATRTQTQSKPTALSQGRQRRAPKGDLISQ